jgi:hypothetical protein
MPKPPPVAAQGTTGPIDKVPCPWCGKLNNFAHGDGDLFHPTDVSQGQHDPGGGPAYACDHCTKPMRIVAVKTITFLTVRQAK